MQTYWAVFLVLLLPQAIKAQTGSSSTRVNSDGIHTVILHNGNSSVEVNQEGSDSLFDWIRKRKRRKKE